MPAVLVCVCAVSSDSVAHDDCNRPYLDSPMLRYAQTLYILAVIDGAHVNKRVQMRLSG
jgi:hypothetical protein